MVRSRGIDPTQSENSPKVLDGSGGHDQSSPLARSSTEEAPNMALDKAIKKDDPAPDHASSSPIHPQISESIPQLQLVITRHKVSSKSDRAQSQVHSISSSADASNSNAEPPKVPEQSTSTSQVDQSKSNDPQITEDMRIQDTQSGEGRRPDAPMPESLPDEEPYSSYVNEEDYGREEDYDSEQNYDSRQDYDQEQDHGKEQNHSQDSTSSDPLSSDPTGSILQSGRLVAIDFTVYRTE
ncbi:copii coat assembly sec16 [Fusarium mexicanum]|uniref:Copii coat assembly sec16 n=1 Tax=Fusarium mexicanum TaxID=751941 RepID=A0A8H5MZT0_9HYPO|nr:copii coat assembly sec16 [Fusarium mexicanum]